MNVGEEFQLEHLIGQIVRPKVNIRSQTLLKQKHISQCTIYLFIRCDDVGPNVGLLAVFGLSHVLSHTVFGLC
jgi:hypothetical protein